MSSMLIPFVLLGKFLETIAKSKTGEAITALLKLRATTCLLVQFRDGDYTSGVVESERDIPVDYIQKNDLLKVCPDCNALSCDSFDLFSGAARPFYSL